MGYIHSVQLNNNTYLIEPVLFSIAGGTSTALTANISNFELVPGVTIGLYITINNDASATLSINGNTAIPIYYKGAVITDNILKTNYIYNFIYDGTVWNVIGEKLASDELILPHKLTFGASGVYQFDGSVDVTVPVYTGGII